MSPAGSKGRMAGGEGRMAASNIRTDGQPAVSPAFTCPMHPEVVLPRPDPCPICGMALEPLAASAVGDPESNPELRDMSRRLFYGLALALPVLLLGMADMFPGLRTILPVAGRAGSFLQIAFTTPLLLYCGWPFFQRGWVSVVTGRLNMFTLIATGTGAAYIYSALATLVPGLFPAPFRSPGGEVPVYFESASVIIVLVLLGQVLELRARDRTRDALRALARIVPQTALRVASDGGETEIAAASIRPGDRLRVRPGERVPTDGIVLEGSSSVDESFVTGESIPVETAPGSRLIGGAINGNGGLVMRAEQTGEETVLARIIRQVGEAQRSRAPIQRLADTVSAWFVPAVLIAAAVTFLVWSIAGPEPRLAHALLSSVAVLIIACPCALGLATPMSIMVGAGRGATAGVLIRDAEALERLEKVDTLVIDKTGTLTEGRPRLEAIVPFGGISETDLLTAAASLERGSEHPLAAAIVAAARQRELPLGEVRELEAVPGGGVSGSIAGRRVLLGTERFLRDAGIEPAGAAIAGTAASLRRQGQTVVSVAIDGKPAGLLGVADPIRATTNDAIRALRSEGIEIVMLTGDNLLTATAVADRLGIDRLIADALPEDKAAEVDRLRAAGGIVAVAGDGVNDAPALARADVGIAMGTGTDVAMESAGLTLVKGDLRALVRARRLSRATMRNIRQNLFFAFAYNALCVPLAAGALYPLFGILLSPMIAGAAMSLSSVTVIGNALRLRRVDLTRPGIS